MATKEALERRAKAEKLTRDLKDVEDNGLCANPECNKPKEPERAGKVLCAKCDKKMERFANRGMYH